LKRRFCRLLAGPLCLHLDILRRLKGPERLGYLIGFSLGEGPAETAVAVAFYAVGNMERSPVSFTADPLDTIAAHKAAWNLGLDVIAFYHTHPRGSATPSAEDAASMRRWPIIWVIGSPREVRAYKLDKASGSMIECVIDCSPGVKSISRALGERSSRSR
jgi:proteasome lid subunit RPN8/RPN11